MKNKKMAAPAEHIYISTSGIPRRKGNVGWLLHIPVYNFGTSYHYFPALFGVGEIFFACSGGYHTVS